MPAIIFITLFWFAIFKMTMNYQGYCADTGRILTNDELVAAAIDNAEWFAAAAAEKNAQYIKYKDAKELLAQNPDCCKLYFESPEMYWTDKVDGSWRAWMDINYLGRYRQPDGQIKSKEVSHFAILGNCGVTD